MTDDQSPRTYPELAAPPDFELLQEEGRVAIVSEKAPHEIGRALLKGEGCEPLGAVGRGGVWTFSYPGGTGVVRKYRRGGALGDLGVHVYLGNRPLQEFNVHREAESRGVAVPPLLGVMWEQQGVAFRGALATERLMGEDLLSYLRYRDSKDASQVLRRCGGVIRQMHETGLWHADLQVKNLFVSGDMVYVLDLDKAAFRVTLRKRDRMRNLLRLRRSFEKRGLPVESFQRILEGYGDEKIPVWLDAVYRARGIWSDRVTRRK
jgi:3-deoxy-D-manno-octulosonic acid kinase